MYMVLKMCSPTRAVVIDLSQKGRKSFCVKGNLPKLYHGMFINMQLGEMLNKSTVKVTDYEFPQDDKTFEKNVNILKKNGADVIRYLRTAEIHKQLKNGDEYTWEIADTNNFDEVYRELDFPKADKIHKQIVNNATDKCRIDAINEEIIKYARRKRKIAYNINEYLSYFSNVEQEGAYQQLMISLKILALKSSVYGFKNGAVYDNDLKKKEDYVNENLQKRLSFNYPLLTEKEADDFKQTLNGLEEEQTNVLNSLLTSKPCVVTGGAGVGKTTVIKAVIDCYTKYHSKSNVLLLAPTGKASRRLAEKVGMNASTIHKALRKSPEDRYVYFCEKRKLSSRLIIVDESSMIDTELMYDLLRATEISSKIIFVGDHNQLYPVGY